MEITQELVRQKFFYHPEAGLIFRKNKKGQLHKICNAKNSFGYVQFGIGSKKVSAHRIAWLYVHGEIGDYEIDHIDGNPLNNKLKNLRLATRSQNMMNRRMLRNNTSGEKNISWSKRKNKWVVSICVRKIVYTSYFDSFEDAKIHANNLRKKHHGCFSRKDSSIL